jgi:hypothetical protein
LLKCAKYYDQAQPYFKHHIKDWGRRALKEALAFQLFLLQVKINQPALAVIAFCDLQRIVTFEMKRGLFSCGSIFFSQNFKQGTGNERKNIGYAHFVVLLFFSGSGSSSVAGLAWVISSRCLAV